MGKAVIELCEVSRLGWFIEIEIVVKSPDDKLIAAAEIQILDILKTAGIPREKIEPQYYSDMLLNNQ
jgi:adenylate cyclase class IV